MTDDRTPLTDEELSAAIDGEADADVDARIEADPRARARRDELAAAAERVAELPTPALAAVDADRIIAAALDAPAAPAAPARSRPTTTWLVAAAVILLVGVGLTLVFAGRAGEDDVASTGAAESFDTVGNEVDDAGAPSAAPEPESAEHLSGADVAADGQASTTTGPAAEETAAVVELGDFASGADLREALATSFAEAARSSSADATDRPAPTSIDRCAEQLQVTLELADGAQQVGIATVDGDPVLVYEFATTATDDGSPTTLVAAVGVDACDPIELFER